MIYALYVVAYLVVGFFVAGLLTDNDVEGPLLWSGIVLWPFMLAGELGSAARRRWLK